MRLGRDARSLKLGTYRVSFALSRRSREMSGSGSSYLFFGPIAPPVLFVAGGAPEVHGKVPGRPARTFELVRKPMERGAVQLAAKGIEATLDFLQVRRQ